MEQTSGEGQSGLLSSFPAPGYKVGTWQMLFSARPRLGHVKGLLFTQGKWGSFKAQTSNKFLLFSHSRILRLKQVTIQLDTRLREQSLT